MMVFSSKKFKTLLADTSLDRIAGPAIERFDCKVNIFFNTYGKIWVGENPYSYLYAVSLKISFHKKHVPFVNFWSLCFKHIMTRSSTHYF